MNFAITDGTYVALVCGATSHEEAVWWAVQSGEIPRDDYYKWIANEIDDRTILMGEAHCDLLGESGNLF